MSYHEELRERRRKFFSRMRFAFLTWFSLKRWFSLTRRGLRAFGRFCTGCWWTISFHATLLFRYKIPSFWDWLTNGGLRPWIKGPEFLEPDEFVASVRRYRPRTLSHHFWHDPSSDRHTINFFFRKGRMIYATVLPFHLETTGFYPDGLPEPFFKFCLGSPYRHRIRTSLTRDPAGRLEREPERQPIKREKLKVA